MFDNDQFRVDERITRNSDKSLEPGSDITVVVPTGEEPFGLPDSSDLARGD